jgi:hypothetical protein
MMVRVTEGLFAIASVLFMPWMLNQMFEVSFPAVFDLSPDDVERLGLAATCLGVGVAGIMAHSLKYGRPHKGNLFHLGMCIVAIGSALLGVWALLLYTGRGDPVLPFFFSTGKWAWVIGLAFMVQWLINLAQRASRW